MRRVELVERIAHDCIYFRDSQPCPAHQRRGELCRCPMYSPVAARILVVQLSPPEAVIAASALVRRLKADQPNGYLTFLTDFPELLPGEVDEPLRLDDANLLRLQLGAFTTVYNLDKDKRACAVATTLNADTKKGFILRQGHVTPIDADSYTSYLKSVVPKTCRDAPPGVVREMFQICGLEYRCESPRLTAPDLLRPIVPDDDVVVGLHSTAWLPNRKGYPWEADRWAKISNLLREQGITPLLLGDIYADRFNQQIAQQSMADYPGPLTLQEFVGAAGLCDVLVSGDTMAVELAGAMGKEAVWLQGDSNITHYSITNYDRPTLMILPGETGAKAGLVEVLPESVFAVVMTSLSRRAQGDGAWQGAEGKGEVEVDLSAMRGHVARGRRRPT